MNERGRGKAKHKAFCLISFFVDKEMLTFNSLFGCFFVLQQHLQATVCSFYSVSFKDEAKLKWSRCIFCVLEVQILSLLFYTFDNHFICVWLLPHHICEAVRCWMCSLTSEVFVRCCGVLMRGTFQCAWRLWEQLGWSKTCESSPAPNVWHT